MRILTVALVVFALTTVSGAAVVKLTMEYYPDGTFDLWAEASDGDNAGICGVSVDMVCDTLENHASFGLNAGYQNMGFITAHEAKDMGSYFQLLAAQDVQVQTSQLYGIGQTAGEIPGWPGVGLYEQVVWGDPYWLGSGTYSGDAPSWGPTQVANVFVSDEGGSMEAGVVLDIVPEPATLCLLGLGALALIRRKR